MKKYYNIIFLVGIGLFIACNSTTRQEEATQKPNIIFILADDLGYEDIEPYGQQFIQTPNLNKMAQEGILFTQHYAGSTVCAPSRCALMTGYHMGHAEVRGNKMVDPSGQAPISESAITVATLLKSAGYRTACIGKWGLGVENSTGNPLKHGFDHYFGYLDQVLAHNSYPEYLLRNDKKVYLKNEVKYYPKDHWTKGLGSVSTKKVDFSQDYFLNEALAFLDENKKNPFFLYLPFTIPHNNGEAEIGSMMEISDNGIYEDEDWPSDTKAYAAMITRMDKDIGIIMEKIAALGIDDNTLVIFSSDNGPLTAKHFNFMDFFDSKRTLKGGKMDLYEGGIRIPFIARWDGKIQAGIRSAHISAFWDFLPTACEIANIDAPKNIDGISYLPTLLGQEQQPHEYLYWEYDELGYSVAVRKGKWKAIRNNMEKNSNGPIELYDLETDISEEKNVAAQHPDIVNEMEGLLRQARTVSKDFPMPGE